MQNYWNKLLLITIFTCFSLGLMAQAAGDNSPYSRYGLGNIWSTDYPILQGMGGISTAYASPFNLNVSNPASLASLATTTFETGIFGRYDLFTAGTESSEVYTGNLTHLALAFPLKNTINRITEGDKSEWNFGMSIGLMPYSTVGYDIAVNDSIPNIGDVQYEYLGSGGLYQLFWGNAMRYKGFSAGLNLGYIFGQTSNERVANFPDLENSFADILTSERNYRGFTWKLGLQYEHVFGDTDASVSTRVNKTRLTVGLTANSNQSLEVVSRDISKRFNTFHGLDTVKTTTDIEGTVTLPTEVRIGAILSKDYKWKIGIDYMNGRWSKYENSAQPDVLADTWRFGFGGEWIPNAQSYNKYAQRMTYRIGGFVGSDPRIVAGEQLSQYALTLGIGLPLEAPKKGTIGFANFALEVGQLGSAAVIKDTYVKLNIGFSLNDNTWFYKQRFK